MTAGAKALLSWLGFSARLKPCLIRIPAWNSCYARKQVAGKLLVHQRVICLNECRADRDEEERH